MRERAQAQALCSGLFPDRDSERLYRKALAQQWRIDDVDFGALDLAQVARPVRKAMGAIYGDILAAEIAGLRLVGSLVHLTPESWVRQLAATQVMDEARHVDFFGRVVAQLDAPGAPSDPLRMLCEEVLNTRDLDALALGNLLVETTAQAIFIEGSRHNLRLARTAVQIPGSDAVRRLLAYVLRYIGRDEARHVAFGVSHLGGRLAELSPGRRSELVRQVLPWCRLLQSHYSLRSADYARLGFSPRELLVRLWQVQRRQLGSLGIEIGEWAGADGAEQPARGGP